MSEAEAVVVKEIKFETECYLEGSWGARKLGKLPCTMVLTAGPGNSYSEICFEAGDEVEHIGIFHDENKFVRDYDGVFNLPDEAVELLKSCGYNTIDVE